MTTTYHIAGYCSVFSDEQMNLDNSIAKQKDAIRELVELKYPGSNFTLFADCDCSEDTFQQREGFQAMYQSLIDNECDILVMKNLSRISRFNSRGLMYLEDLRDHDVRIISIDDNIDSPNIDDRMALQMRYLIGTIPVRNVS